ncbi:DUF960 family protein [Vallitalea guaymasensis]|uniref:DUF960 family protein n=1 Tax=Vallitalea guaymasensis TaxID=1185412 RepID=UPI000DE38D8C
MYWVTIFIKFYITSGVNAEIPLILQLLIQRMFYSLCNKKDIKVDYLQVFTFKNKGNYCKITHTQVVP